jgi:ATP-binding cassette subfamily F protein uup
VPEVKEIVIQQPAPKAEQKKLSFKEKLEFETIEKEMPLLQKEKADLELQMNDGSMPFDQLQKAAERISTIITLLDEKEMRWLELSERI